MSAAGPLSHAALAPVASHLNERNRASKHARRDAPSSTFCFSCASDQWWNRRSHTACAITACLCLPRFHIRGSLASWSALAAAAAGEGGWAILPATETTWEEVNPIAGAGRDRSHQGRHDER